MKGLGVTLDLNQWSLRDWVMELMEWVSSRRLFSFHLIWLSLTFFLFSLLFFNMFMFIAILTLVIIVALFIACSVVFIMRE